MFHHDAPKTDHAGEHLSGEHRLHEEEMRKNEHFHKFHQDPNTSRTHLHENHGHDRNK